MIATSSTSVTYDLIFVVHVMAAVAAIIVFVTMRYSALFSAGYDFAIKGLIMSPTITYDFPFSTVRDVDESGWKLSSLYASMTFKFAP